MVPESNMAVRDFLRQRFPRTTFGRGARRDGVVYCRGEHRKTVRVSLHLFGRELDSWEYAALAGAPQSAEILVGTLQGGLYLEMRPRQEHDYLTVTLVRLEGRRLVVVNDGFHIYRRSMQGKGFGLRVFGRQLRQAKSMGADCIQTMAGRGSRENGYYTWPRFGFDAPLPPQLRPRLPAVLARAGSVLDLMDSEEGRDWWKRHGTTVSASFDLADQSRSWQVFHRYRGEKSGGLK